MRHSLHLRIEFRAVAAASLVDTMRSWLLVAFAANVMQGLAGGMADAGEDAGTALGRATSAELTLGLERGDCKKCHPSEVNAWRKSTHFYSAAMRLEQFESNTAKYADALGVAPETLMTSSLCADCHGTRTRQHDGGLVVTGGVSCEKCHGASGGDDGWWSRHQSYHGTRVVPRHEETALHREQRITACQEAGMVRSTDIAEMARACYSCHLVNEPKLVAAGHKLASTFDFVSWSEGEVRHNFLLNSQHNAEAPSLWIETTGRTAVDRRRVKFVVGTLVQLEAALLARAETTSPTAVPQIGGLVAAANGKLMQINGVAATPQVAQVVAVTTPLLSRLFVSMPDDSDVYLAAAERVAQSTNEFERASADMQLSGVDILIALTQPYFSQQFRSKYLRRSGPAE